MIIKLILQMETIKLNELLQVKFRAKLTWNPSICVQLPAQHGLHRCQEQYTFLPFNSPHFFYLEQLHLFTTFLYLKIIFIIFFLHTFQITNHFIPNLLRLKTNKNNNFPYISLKTNKNKKMRVMLLQLANLKVVKKMLHLIRKCTVQWEYNMRYQSKMMSTGLI